MASRVTPEQAHRAREWLSANFIPCPACSKRQAGPIHRTSVQLWDGRLERARRNDGTDPYSGVTAEECERHLAVIPPR